ncbi:TetR/AcrR family transcriptional regulator [Streptomyces sp. NPDC006641]|uniref:TetR/AcrR family transcriptional regulator n=1 Tax=unclassified Streptomyces TaxID=2593676 RepID=UPI002E7AA982|nr:TetR/AcrR family transcriptional regulator [Streptomyces sp. JV184]MEE1743003.1 TetR/AcrR family transcriptional regulator [Streptomyces sp. JV184]
MTITRGQADRRQAILEGAFTVFARRGYAQACVKEVAAEAGVAKPTVYNHLNDKATLFRQSMQAAAQVVLDERLAALEPLKEPDDLHATLEDVGHRLLQLHTDDRSCALRRLLYAEITQFPDLIDIVVENGPHRLTQALADRLARLTLAGRLRANDPDQAAEQLIALLTGPLEVRSRMGTRQIDDAEVHQLARAAIRTFLATFGTADG